MFDKTSRIISSGRKGTKIWNLTDSNCLAKISDGWADCGNSMKRINEDKIVVGSHSSRDLRVISLNEKKLKKSASWIWMLWNGNR